MKRGERISFLTVTEMISASRETEKLKEKLLSGESLSPEEVEQMRSYIAGLRATIEFLIETADMLEQRLAENSAV